VISLFTGGGGLDLGLELAGFETRVAVEVESYACSTLRQNQGHVLEDDGSGRGFLDAAEVIERDIRRVPIAEILRKGRLRKGEATLLAGGPPCVTFSVAGKREGLMAETGRLFEEYVRILRGTRPAALLFENVKGLLTAADEDGMRGGAFARIYSALEAEGYALVWQVVNAADYGVPQQRERLIIVGRKSKRPFQFPEPTYHDPERPALRRDGMHTWRTVRDAIDDLCPAAEPGTEPLLANHVARRHTAEVMRAFAATPPGKRNDAYKRDRLRWDRPAKVIRAQGKPKPDGSGQKNSSHQAIHPDEHRQLTVRECARIQTFPDWYLLPDTFVNGYRILGDAVPVELARVLGRAIRAQIQTAQPRTAAAADR
jgi:DNA (cytosine-5)-methyltransferase 1